ncbi:glycosyltransferase [Marinoscillum furvescens]|uniref:Glycogen(Starch) synthase n=1 Tax=Marinoscillum furvescens DSM 4134 TaxID=1122208 RepID=A0A3D9L599_MARFU|nr:glycosyltransferase [Marinoscillum furvescens]RED99574.1 glycogen(starch) synthase [Marinoscillum furvescens DSM 4134]
MPKQGKTSPRRLTKSQTGNALLLEIAWEVLNQVGGIYTVIRSKVPTVVPKWGENYCLLGPYMPSNVAAEFEPIEGEPTDAIGRAVQRMRDNGYTVHYGVWLVSGRPKVVLFDLGSVMHRLGEIKYLLWEHHSISTPGDDHLLNDVLAFGEMVKIFLSELAAEVKGSKEILAHFHEWMAASGLPDLRREQVPVKTIFTTHATLLGRYLAMNDPQFYDHLPFVDWQKEARHFNIESNVMLERAAAHGAHVFSTVSEVTAAECRQLLGRNPDVILPNGINNQRFEALHEFQNLHLENKNKIHSFTMSHFFSSYTFDLDKTLYFFTSGRYEFLNKGYDLTLEALARLNHRLKTEKSDITVVMFFITKRPYYSINPEILHSRALLEEFRHTIDAIKKQVGERLLFDAVNHKDTKLPELNKFVDDYWKLRFRRTLQSWKSDNLPPVITHNLHDDATDDILNFLRRSNLVNNEEDPVKVVYHPDFINYTNPLFSMEYGQFVRGCHLGVFPSYYEPWGYTPLECIASGVPTVTSDLAGFGDYVQEQVPDHDRRGIYLVKRNQKSFDEAAGNLANKMYNYVRLSRRDRIDLRNRTEASSTLFDWSNLVKYYDQAYLKALKMDQ